MSRRRPARRRRPVIGMVQRLDLRCPVDDSHSLGVVIRDAGGVRLRPAADKSETVVNSPDVPLRREGSRLRWTCPACRRRGLYEDRQLRWDRIEGLMDAMRWVTETLRVAADPAELSRHADRLRAQRST